ncbi:unnamed protein product [Aphis gossypii]|uniref:Uncharacterized protein n=1 Tax=Aphis gossypii TaxID=80765 RepID=A0A9P0JJQ9_APHGO|nr:unnamed protein product [Aphis gossypii]
MITNSFLRHPVHIIFTPFLGIDHRRQRFSTGYTAPVAVGLICPLCVCAIAYLYRLPPLDTARPPCEFVFARTNILLYIHIIVNCRCRFVINKSYTTDRTPLRESVAARSIRPTQSWLERIIYNIIY